MKNVEFSPEKFIRFLAIDIVLGWPILLLCNPVNFLAFLEMT
jgi:hypothetical protein